MPFLHLYYYFQWILQNITAKYKIINSGKFIGKFVHPVQDSASVMLVALIAATTMAA